MTYQEINPTTWKPENEGDFIEGVLVTSEDNVGKNNSWVYNIETPEGVKSVWGSAVLDMRMTFVKIGDKVKITFKGLGEAKPGRSPPKIFRVDVDRD